MPKPGTSRKTREITSKECVKGAKWYGVGLGPRSIREAREALTACALLSEYSILYYEYSPQQQHRLLVQLGHLSDILDLEEERNEFPESPPGVV